MEEFPFDQVVFRSITFLVCVFGSIANILNVLVFAHRRMREVLINKILLALSATDLVLLVSSLIVLPLPVFAEKSGNARAISASNYATFIIFPIANAAQFASVYITLGLSLFRYVGLSRPFLSRIMLTDNRVVATILYVCILAVVFATPRWLAIELVQERIGNVSLTAICQTAWGKTRTYIIEYKVVTNAIIMFIIPFTLLTLVNCKLIQSLQTASRLRKTMMGSEILARRKSTAKGKQGEISTSVSKERNARNKIFLDELHSDSFCSRDRRELKTTAMLLCVVCIFLICNLLPLIISCIECAGIDLSQNTSLVELCNLLVCLSSAVNITIYYNLSSKYKALLLGLVGRISNDGQHPGASDLSRTRVGRCAFAPSIYGSTAALEALQKAQDWRKSKHQLSCNRSQSWSGLNTPNKESVVFL